MRGQIGFSTSDTYGNFLKCCNMPKQNILRYVVSLTSLFVAASLLGFLAPIPGKRDLPGTLLDSYVPFLALPPWKMFFVILLNNSAKSFAVLLSGILFGLVPLIAVAVTGYVLGVAYLFGPVKSGMCRRQRRYCHSVCRRSRQLSSRRLTVYGLAPGANREAVNRLAEMVENPQPIRNRIQGG